MYVVRALTNLHTDLHARLHARLQETYPGLFLPRRLTGGQQHGEVGELVLSLQRHQFRYGDQGGQHPDAYDGHAGSGSATATVTVGWGEVGVR